MTAEHKEIEIDRENIIRIPKDEYEDLETLTSLIPYEHWENYVYEGHDEWGWALGCVFMLLDEGKFGHVDKTTSETHVYIDKKGATNWIAEALERERKVRLEKIFSREGLYPPDGKVPDSTAGKKALAKLVQEMEQ